MGDILRATGLLFSMQLRAVLGSRRALVALLLAAIPPVIAAVGAQFAPDRVEPGQIIAAISFWLNLQVVVPILALVAGSSVVTEEIENRTITYLFTRPIPRAAVFFGRWLATVVLVSLLVCASAALVVFFASRREGDVSAEVALRVIAASFAGGVMYSLLFAVIGVFIKWPMVVGLGYAFAFEVALANVPGGSQSLTIQYYLRSIAVEPSLAVWREIVDEPFILSTLERPLEAAGTLALVFLAALVVGGLGISRRQYVLTA